MTYIAKDQGRMNFKAKGQGHVLINSCWSNMV